MDDIGDGRVRWFGPPWSANVNETCEQVPAPVGEICMYCNEAIKKGERGVAMVHTDNHGSQYRPMHIDCFGKMMGVQFKVQRAPN